MDLTIEVHILKEGKYVMDNLYSLVSDHEKRGMTDTELAEIITKFKTSIFDDLIIDVKEVFEDIIDEENYKTF